MSPFEELRREFSLFDGDYTPPWGLPREQDFTRIQTGTGISYPERFVLFQTRCAAQLPSFPDGFRWANSNLEPYLSLEDLIDGVRASSAPANFLPFADDEGDYVGFVAQGAGVVSEPGVVRWDHVSETLGVEAGNFVDWLRWHYAEHVRRQAAMGDPR